MSPGSYCQSVFVSASSCFAEGRYPLCAYEKQPVPSYTHHDISVINVTPVCVRACVCLCLCCTCYRRWSGVCFSNNSLGYETWVYVSVRACLLVCAHTALLPRWLNYEAFTAVVMASSAFGNMSFYFRLGPNIQFEEGSQTIHDLFKKSSRG